MTARVYRAGRYVSQPSRDPEEPKGFNNTMRTVEGTATPSRYRPDGGDAVHRDMVKEYVQHDTNHAPYESAKRRNAPQVSAPHNRTSGELRSGGSIDLGAVTKAQHKQLTDKSRKGKRKA